MTEDAPDRIWAGIDIPKTIAGVLATVSAAVIGSFLGVAGTLVGAAVASVIGSVGTEIYHRSISKGTRKLRGTFTTAPAAVGTPPVPAERSPGTLRNIRWRRVALVAGGVFILAMGTLTVAELVAGRSVADVTRGGTGDRLTFSSIFDDKSRETKPTPAPSTSTPAPESTTTTPATDPTTDAGTPSPEPTTAPTTQAPTEGPTATTGTGDSGKDDSGTGTGEGGGGETVGGAATHAPAATAPPE